jgi:hypothetical protein
LLSADTDAARTALVRSVELDRAARQAKGQSINISQHHVGQMLNEFVLDKAVLTRVQAAVAGPVEHRIAALRDIVRAAPDQTAPALMLLLAARQAGLFDRPPQSGPALGHPAIPRVIAQYWTDAAPPEDVAALMASWQAVSPGFDYRRFDDESAAAFIAEHHDAGVLEAFRRAGEPAQRADLFRLAFLAHAGGVYVDADDLCLAPITDWAPDAAELVLYQENYATVGNNVIAAAPGHPLIAHALDLAVQALRRGDSDVVWLATGPGLLTRALADLAAADETWLTKPTVHVLELWEMQRVVGMHSPARYKSTPAHWSRAAFQGDASLNRPRLISVSIETAI